MTKKKPLTTFERRIEFHYLKSNLFRVIKVDGVFGGVNASTDIQMSLFNERQSIPKSIVVETSEDGTSQKEIKRTYDKEGIVRELDVGLLMSPAVARSIAHWMLEKADIVEKMVNEQIANDLAVKAKASEKKAVVSTEKPKPAKS
jgi:hypothetical protein